MALLPDWMIRDLCVETETTRHTKSRLDLIGFDKPMISPFSETVSGDGKVGWGLTSAGYDLRLGPEIWVSKNTYGEVVSPKKMKEPGYTEKVYDKLTLSEGQPLILPPHSYVLGRTYEYLHIPPILKGRVVGKSTLARAAILINCTPLEPAWEGYLVVEIGNVSSSTVELIIMEGIAQLEFEIICALPEVDYKTKGGKYNKQMGVTPAIVN